MGKRWKNFESRDRKSLNCLKQTAGRNIDVKGSSAKFRRK